MMRRTMLHLVTVALMLAMMLAPGAGASAGQSARQRPFRATLEGAATNMELPPTPGTRDRFGVRCSVPSDWVISFEGSGVATHLGALTWTGSHCTQFDPENLWNTTFSDGHVVYVAANGDLLFQDYGNGEVSLLTPTLFCLDDDATFTGGTGRFEQASGSAVERVCLDPQGGPMAPFVVKSTGTIAFDASDRAG